MNTHQFKRYLFIFGLIVLIVLTFVIITAYVVDPYNDLGRNRIGLFFSTSRQEVNRINETPHDAIIIGSSRVAVIRADYLCGYDFYNASFESALPEEIFLYLKEYAHDIDLVMVGIDFYMFNQKVFPLNEEAF